jgi:aspartyl-tRNA(Asn)/glutamyl-tRNA(Gln) amidotransferase subunit A
MTPVHLLSATELVARFRDRTLSPVEATEAVLARIAAWEPHLHALYALDPQAAREAAKASEARWAAGAPHGALDGVPVTVKENIATRGVPVPLGTAASELVPAVADAPPAARLREAGAVILAKTTMPDFGMLSSGLSSFHALARNPWRLDRNPGGSSAGAGAAAAAGYGPLHVGTDIGGSVRLPGGWCGLATLKPSFGRVPIDPPYHGRVAGPMARTVEDVALAMGVLAQPDARDTMSLPHVPIDWRDLGCAVAGLRIGVLLDAGVGLPVEPAVRDAVRAAADRFADAGADVRDARPFLTRTMLDGMDRFWRLRSHLAIDAMPRAKREAVLPFIRAWAEGGAGATGAQVFEGYAQMGAMRDAAVAAHRPFDAVLSPVSPVVSFPADWPMPTNDPARAMEHIAFTLPYNMSEQPAATVNAGWSDDGMPIGLQIAGDRFDDLAVLRIARAWERLRGPQRPWPEPPRP